MLKHSRLLGICITGILLVQLYSCIKPPNNFDPRDGNNVYTACRVKSVNSISYAYNSNDDPVSFVHGNVGTGNPNLFFKYDDKGRLIEFAGLDGPTIAEFVHRYTYNHQRIVVDTEYIFGTYGIRSSFIFKRIIYPTYDNLNRIIKDSVVQDGYYGVTNYPYKEDGNRFTGAVYDNKLNPHRTNKIWMFIDREYSVNNPVAALTYNSAGLPLIFSAKNGIHMTFGYFSWSGDISFVYDCR